MGNSDFFFFFRSFDQFICRLNAIVFLFVFSTGSLILPSILPKTTFIGILLLIGVCILNLSSAVGFIEKHNKIEFLENINYSNIVTPVIGLSLLFLLFYVRLFGEVFNFVSSFASLVLHVLFLVFIVNTRNYFLQYIKYYIYLVVLMALCGLFALLLLSLGLVDLSDWVNITELTGGAFTRDIGSENIYIFPYNLSFVLTGSGKVGLFHFYRISGWAHEPTSATLFVAPAIIMLLHTKIISKTLLRFSALTLIAFFWCFAMSVGSFLTFAMIYFIFFTVMLFIKIFPLKMTLAIIFFVSTLILAGTFYFEDLISSSALASRINLESESVNVLIQQLTFFMPNSATHQTTSLSTMVIFSIIFFFFINIIFSLINEKDINPYALILLYILIHSMKGSQDSVYVLTFAFFWFYALHFSMPFKTKSVKSLKTRNKLN